MMVVDGTRDTCRLVRYLLREMGHEAAECHSGPEVLKEMERGPDRLPDLLLLEVMLPGIAGWEVARQMRGHPSWGRVPVLITTTAPSEACIQRAWALGAAGMLTKPFSVGLFQQCISAVLGDSGSRPVYLPVFFDPRDH